AGRVVDVPGDLHLVRADGIQAASAQVVDGCPESDHLGDRLRAGLELPGQVVIGGALDADRLDHVATGHERVHRLEQLAASVQDAGACRAEHLVAAEGIEVASQCPDVHRLVRRALRSVDQYGRAGLLCGGDHVASRVDGAHRVAHQVERDQLRTALQKVCKLVLPQLALLVDVDVLDVGASLGGQDLPGHDVGVVVEDRQHDEVALRDVLATPRVGDQVDRFGRAPGVD